MWTSFTHSHSSSKGLARGRSTAEGFTVIELLAVVSIITLLTTIFLLQQRRFDSATLLRSLSYSVALSIRQAQVYGTSVREISAGVSPPAYGVYMSAGDTSHYILFADSGAGNGQYDVGEAVQTFTIGQGYSIVDFCGIQNSSVRSCKTGGVGVGGTAVDWLTIYFRRPNPDARFSSSSTGESYIGAYIQLQGPGGAGDTRSVNISLTGQISVGAKGS